MVPTYVSNFLILAKPLFLRLTYSACYSFQAQSRYVVLRGKCGMTVFFSYIDRISYKKNFYEFQLSSNSHQNCLQPIGSHSIEAALWWGHSHQYDISFIFYYLMADA